MPTIVSSSVEPAKNFMAWGQAFARNMSSCSFSHSMNLFLLFQNSSTEVTDSTVQNTSQTKSDVVSRLLGKGIGEINQMYETSNNLRLSGKGINVKCTKCTKHLIILCC